MDQLDELMESDILEALGEDVTDTLESEKEFTEQKDETSAVNEEIILEDMNDVLENKSNIDTEKVVLENKQMNTSDLASLLSQLLTNKTIEITIKIKD